jgi:hypothetical protein
MTYGTVPPVPAVPQPPPVPLPEWMRCNRARETPSSSRARETPSGVARTPSPPRDEADYAMELPPWRQPLNQLSSIRHVTLVSHDNDVFCWNPPICEDAAHIWVTHFKNPHVDREIRRHDGRNMAMQEKIITLHTEGVKRVLTDLKRYLERCSDEGDFHPEIHIVCNHGKHRSVAAVEIIAMTLRYALQEFATEVSIQHRSLMNHNRWCKDRCDPCNHGRTPMSKTLGRAFEKY